MLAAAGLTVDGLAELTGRCARLRQAAGQGHGRWSPRCLLAALQLAAARDWDPTRAAAALLTVAADPATRSPMRLAEAGPWWDQPTSPTAGRSDGEERELADLEVFLTDRDDRAALQQHARHELTRGGQPVTRLTVARRAAHLARRMTISDAAAAAATVAASPSHGPARETAASGRQR